MIVLVVTAVEAAAVPEKNKGNERREEKKINKNDNCSGFNLKVC